MHKTTNISDILYNYRFSSGVSDRIDISQKCT